MTDQETGATAQPTDAPVAGGAPTMPLFYKAPQPVNARRHAKLGVRRDADLGFAATTNVLPIGLGEFAVAARHYPLVFAAEAPHMPVAICGLRNGENVFVTAGRQWVPDAYVPAYVRRYPFVFMEAQDGKQMILCVDEDSGLVSEGGDLPLFDADGKRTEVVERAVEFCRMYHQQHQATRQFVEALAGQGLLTDNTTEIRLPENRKIELKGYMIVDRAKFDALDDAVFLDWRKRGWLAAIYYNLQSGSNWGTVMRHVVERGQEKAAAEAEAAKPKS